MSATDPSQSIGRSARRQIFWASVWLAVILVALKAFYLGLPNAPAVPVDRGYLRSLAAISYLDVLFAAVVWAVGRLALVIVRGRPLATRAVSTAVVLGSALFCLYGAVN